MRAPSPRCVVRVAGPGPRSVRFRRMPEEPVREFASGFHFSGSENPKSTVTSSKSLPPSSARTRYLTATASSASSGALIFLPQLPPSQRPGAAITRRTRRRSKTTAFRRRTREVPLSRDRRSRRCSRAWRNAAPLRYFTAGAAHRELVEQGPRPALHAPLQRR